MNKSYWPKFYKHKPSARESSFARKVLPYLENNVVDLGCGDGRDSLYFKNYQFQVTGIDVNSNYDVKQDVGEYIKQHPSPNSVYARFFWHSIEHHLQLAILDWAIKWLFIEARTTDDAKLLKTYPDHKRNYVDVAKLVKELKARNFQLIHLEEGVGMSKFGNEDPHLVRIIALRK